MVSHHHFVSFFVASHNHVWISHMATRVGQAVQPCAHCGNYIVEVTMHLSSHDLLAVVSCE